MQSLFALDLALMKRADFIELMKSASTKKTITDLVAKQFPEFDVAEIGQSADFGIRDCIASATYPSAQDGHLYVYRYVVTSLREAALLRNQRTTYVSAYVNESRRLEVATNGRDIIPPQPIVQIEKEPKLTPRSAFS